MANFLITMLAALLALSPARADPIITPIITALLGPGLFGTTLFSIGTFSLTIGAATVGLVTAALGLGIAVLFAPKPRIPPPEDGVIAVQENLPFRVYAYGRCRVAGATMLKEENASALLYVAALTGHYSDGLETLFLNDDQVTVGTSGGRLVGIVTGGADGRYSGSTVQIDSRLGINPETYYDFISSNIPTEWTVNHRGDASASIGMMCSGVSSRSFATVYPYQAPSPSVVGRWYRVFDPRDVTQDPTNPSTFQWSDNPVLCILHFMCFSEFGFRYLYAAAIVPVVQFWIDAANACDDLMPLKAGGTEKRYRLGGWITAQQAKITTLLAMLQTCDGFISRRGQSYAIFVGKYEAPTVILTDDDIAGFIIQTDVATEDKVNEARAKYSSVDNGYVSVDTDPVVDSSDQAERGGSPRIAELDLTWVQSTGQASRLLKREMYRQSVTCRGTLTVFWSGLNAVFERWISVNSNSIPRLSGVIIENKKAVIHPKTRTAEIDFILSGPALDDYDATTDESAPPSIPQRPDTVALPVPSNVIVVGTLLTDPSGSSSVVLDISWDEPFFNGAAWNVNYSVQYRLTDAGAGSPGPWNNQTFTAPTIAALRVSVETGVVPSGTSLDVEVASVGTSSTLSTWSAVRTISTVISSLAPGAPTWIAATGSAGQAALSVTSPNSANFYGVQFYRATHGSPFSSATPIGSVVTGARNATISLTDTVAAGTYDYFAESITSASVASVPAGPQSATVT